MGIECTGYAEWLEDGLRTIYEGNSVSIALVATLGNGDTVTGYYNADAQAKAIFAHHIQSDMILDIVTNNIGLIREALEELEAEENVDQ